MRSPVSALLCLAAGLAGAPGFALAQNAGPAVQGYSCPAGYKQVAKVCLAPDQQHASCLYPETVGGKPKKGNLENANPAACPRHPPGDPRHH